MQRQKDDLQKGNRIIIRWLAHHNPNRDDFHDHVFYFFNFAICIGCFSFFLGVSFGLIIGNVFYFFIVNSINLSLIILIFVSCWAPSILQYTIQIIRKKALKSRGIKFLIRFLYPIGSIVFIFKSPLWGLGISIIAGYLIMYIRNYKEKALKTKLIMER